LQRRGEAKEILHGRIPASGRRPPVRQARGVRLPVLRVFPGVSHRSSRDRRVLGQRVGGSHPGRREDALAHVVIIRSAAHPLDDGAQEEIAIVAVPRSGAGLELRRARAVEGEVVPDRPQLQPVGLVLRPEDVARAARVREQVMDGDLRRDLLVGIVGEVGAERGVQLDLPRLDELEHGDGGEHLVHRPDAELGRHLVLGARLPVGEAVGVGEDDLASLGHEGGPREAVLARGLVQLCAQRRQRLRLGEPRDGEIGRRGDRVHVEPGDEVRALRRDLDDHARDLVAGALLEQGGELRRSARLDLLQLEASRHRAEVHRAVEAPDLRGSSLFEEGLHGPPIARVERVEVRPRLRLRGQDPGRRRRGRRGRDRRRRRRRRAREGRDHGEGGQGGEACCRGGGHDAGTAHERLHSRRVSGRGGDDDDAHAGPWSPWPPPGGACGSVTSKRALARSPKGRPFRWSCQRQSSSPAMARFVGVRSKLNA